MQRKDKDYMRPLPYDLKESVLKKVIRRLEERKIHKTLVKAAKKEAFETALVEREGKINEATTRLSTCNCILDRVYFKSNEIGVSASDALAIFELRQQLSQHLAYLKNYDTHKDVGRLAGERLSLRCFEHSCDALAASCLFLERYLTICADDNRRLTLAELTKRLSPDGEAAQITELLQKTRPFLNNASFLPGNLATSANMTKANSKHNPCEDI